MKWQDKIVAGAVVLTVVTLTAVRTASAWGFDLLWWLRPH
jgi:hypothetical protein